MRWSEVTPKDAVFAGEFDVGKEVMDDDGTFTDKSGIASEQTSSLLLLSIMFRSEK